jgi:hypothetical protein
MNTSSPRLHPVARFLAIALPAVLAVWPLRAAVVLDEPFDYPDGSLITVSGGRWSNRTVAPPARWMWPPERSASPRRKPKT